MKIVFASDSFKGSLTSRQANEAMAEGARRAAGDIDAVNIPISDGGDGFADCLESALKGQRIRVCASGPLSARVNAEYILSGDMAAVEMAAASGIILTNGKNDAMLATTYGTGELIADAVKRGAKKIYLGLGGSATTDGGMGALMALGAAFYDKSGNRIERGCGGTLADIAKADLSGIPEAVLDAEITILCDVDYTLLGAEGAAAVFAPQKGADAGQVKLLDKGLANLSKALPNGETLKKVPGTGAAGGLGFGIMAALNAKTAPGMDTIMELIRFKERLKGADLVFTGEGRIDFQSAHGKAPGVITRAAAELDIPVIVIGGGVKDGKNELLSAGAVMVMAAAGPDIPLEDAIKNAKKYVSEAAYRAVDAFLKKELDR